MLARQMRRAQLAELVLYAAFAAWLHGRGAALTACVLAVPALFLATRLAIVCSMFVLAWLYRAPRAPEERIGLARGIAVVLREYAAFLALNFLRTPWEDQALRPDPPCDAPGNTAIVLVHGYFANRACWSPMVAAIEAAGLGPVYVPSCRSHLASIERFVEDLDAAIARVSRGRRVVLVAHSMGGLAARLWLATHAPGAVVELVTIGSPHHGSALATWAVGENARQMRPGGEWLARLEALEARTPRPPTLSIYSMHDNMVLPQTSSRLAGATNVAVKGVGHVSEFADPAIARLVVEALRERC